MASRKEEKERRREERLQRERQQAERAGRRRKLGVIAGAVAAAAVVVLAVLLLVSRGGGEKKPKPPALEAAKPPPVKIADLDQAAKQADCLLKTYPDEGRGHLAPGEKAPKYKTNPPTSGDHDPVAAHDGAAAKAPPIGKALHAMEHGRVLIQYNPTLPIKRKQQLKGVFDENPERVLLFPNATHMPFEVAATGWTHLLGCKRMTDTSFDAIRAFAKAYRDKGPEQILQPE